MLLKNDVYKVIINEISEPIATENFDYIYDFENYKNEEFKHILRIEVVVFEKILKIALYCDYCGNYELCSVLKNNKLIIVNFNTVYEFDLKTNQARYVVFPDMAGAIGLYDTGDGYLIHGEMCLVKLDYNLNKLWEFFGKDILVSGNADPLVITKDKIELTDFEGNHYIIDLTDDFKRQIIENNDRYCAFKEITKNPIILDFKRCCHCKSLHLMFKEKFGLPEYYGENWDALWDCLSCLFDEGMSIELHNFNLLSQEMKEYCKPLFRILEDLKEETPDFTYKIIS